MNSKTAQSLCLCIFLGLVAYPAFAAAAEGGVEANAAVGLHSRYVSDGREDFNGRSMTTLEADLSYHGFFGAIWFAQSNSQGNSEADYTLGKTFEWDAVSLELSYTYQSFGGKDVAAGESFAHEANAVITCDGCLPYGVTPELEVVYDIRETGYAAILSASKDFEMGNIVISPYALIQYDHEYATERYDGINHYEIGLSAELALTDGTALSVYLSHVFEGEDMRKDDEYTGNNNPTWGGISLSYQF